MKLSEWDDGWLWIAGQVSVNPYGHPGPTGIHGVFLTQEQAVAACASDLDFVAPIPLNVKIISQDGSWPGLYFVNNARREANRKKLRVVETESQESKS